MKTLYLKTLLCSSLWRNRRRFSFVGKSFSVASQSIYVPMPKPQEDIQIIIKPFNQYRRPHQTVYTPDTCKPDQFTNARQ